MFYGQAQLQPQSDYQPRSCRFPAQTPTTGIEGATFSCCLLENDLQLKEQHGSSVCYYVRFATLHQTGSEFSQMHQRKMQEISIQM